MVLLKNSATGNPLKNSLQFIGFSGDADFRSGSMGSHSIARSSTGTAINSSGDVVSYGNNVARFDYDEGVLRGLYVEPTRANRFSRSEEFDNAAWTKYVVTVTPNTAVAPNGTLTADTVSFTAALNTAEIRQVITLASTTTYTLSVWAKVATGTRQFRLKIFDGAAEQSTADLVATTTWQRFTFTFTTGAVTGSPSAAIRNNSAGTTGSLILWGAQLELGTEASSYIPTTTTSVTRAVEVLTLNDLSRVNGAYTARCWHTGGDYTDVAGVSILNGAASLPGVSLKPILSVAFVGGVPLIAVPVIFDTDYDSDIDDVSALALLLGYVASGHASLLAATVASNNDYAAGALRGTLNAGGHSTVPVGAYKGSAIGGGSFSAYAQPIAAFFRPAGEVRTAYPDAVTVLRAALAARVGNPIKTKIIIAGTCTNIAVLLASAADGISALNGSDLVAATVSGIHVMGGNFASPTSIENNIAFDPGAANTVASSSPVPVYWSHYPAGNDVYTGVTDRALAADVIPADPYGEAWTLGAFLQTSGKRQSWDLIAIYDAIFGTGTELLSYGSVGDASFSATSPYCAFTANPSGKSRVVDKIVSTSVMAAAMQSVIDGFVAGVPLLESSFTLPFWTLETGSTITANQYADASGQMLADVYNEGTAAAVHRIYSVDLAITSGVRYRIEMDVRAINAPFAQIVIGDSAFGTGNFANINLSTNTFATTSLSGGTPTTQVTDMGGGIWRYAIEMTATLTGTSNISFGHVPAGNSARNLSWTGTGKTSAISRFKWFSV